MQDRGSRPRVEGAATSAAWSIDGMLDAAQGQDGRGLGAGGAAPVPVDRSLATTRIDRSRSPTAAGPISRADTAYHLQKARELADELINIWGADHAGTVKRIQAAVEALAGRPTLDVKLVQMVRLLRDGEPVKMSKRSGNFVTLAEVVEEVGKDVVRFTMLTRKNDAQMDFDFAKVVEASKDNPVFYVQYAHARIAR